jgi:hypothetical protein
MAIAPAVAPDLPLSPLLPELFAPLFECAELSAVPLEFADAPAFAEAPALPEALTVLPDVELPEALALLLDCEELFDCVLPEALALLSECEELSDVAPDFALASLLLPVLLEELEELEELGELADLPPPVAVSELPPEPAAF